MLAGVLGQNVGQHEGGIGRLGVVAMACSARLALIQSPFCCRRRFAGEHRVFEIGIGEPGSRSRRFVMASRSVPGPRPAMPARLQLPGILARGLGACAGAAVQLAGGLGEQANGAGAAERRRDRSFMM